MLDGRKILVSLVFAAMGAVFAQSATNASGEAYFRANVKPVLENYCYNCHGPSKQKAGLRFDQGKSAFTGATPAVTPGDVEKSLMLSVISYEGRVKMPPKRRLDDEQIATLRKWIEDGAWWPKETP